jgi:putative transposase
MKRARFSEEQIIGILKAAEAAGNIREACRENNISEQTFYRWRRKFGGMEVSEAKKLRELERENSELKKMVAEQALDIRMLKDLNSKNGEPGGTALRSGAPGADVFRERATRVPSRRDRPQYEASPVRPHRGSSFVVRDPRALAAVPTLRLPEDL